MPIKERYRPRLANLTIWALQDIIGLCRDAHDALSLVVEWVERERVEANVNMDKRRKAQLGDLSHAVSRLLLILSAVERIAGDARQGRYDEGRDPDANTDSLTHTNGRSAH